jgi:hypothetical protein
MFDPCPRVTVRLNDTAYDQVQQLAARCEQSLSQVVRDAITLLLADLPRYYDLLNTRLLAHAAPPTAEQAAASARLIDAAMRADLTALFLPTPPPHEPCTTDARGVQI